MKKIFLMGNLYMKNADWKDLALIKICLFAIGLLVGCIVPKEKRTTAVIVALPVFMATYIPLMTKFVQLVIQNKEAVLKPDEAVKNQP